MNTADHPRYAPYQERHGSEDAWAKFEAALDSYMEAEMRVILAAAKMARMPHSLETGGSS
jgi:hypothetical protein